MSDTFGKGIGSLIPGSTSSQPIAQGPVKEKPALPKHEQVRAFYVEPELIDANPFQPRSSFNEERLKELADSIREHGVLEPLIVIEKSDGRFGLIAGERRLQASRSLGLKTVPVVIKNVDDLERLEISLIENLQRQELNLIDEAEGYRELVDSFGLTQDDIARKIGKSRQVISNTLKILELSPEMQKHVANGDLSSAHARILLSIDSPTLRDIVFRKVINNKLSVRETQDYATPKIRRKSVASKDSSVLADEARLREAFNTKVQIEKRGEKGRIIIHFYSNDDYSEMIGKIFPEEVEE